MEPICILAVCLGLFAVLGCSRQNSRPEKEDEKKKDKTEAAKDRLSAPKADLESLFSEHASIGKNRPEFDYGDEDTIIFHGYFGLFVCRRDKNGWNVFRALDLKSFGADAMQGDEYAVIDAGREMACITPSYFATDNRDPVTYCYHYGPDVMWEKRGYEPAKDELLSWSYAQSMPVQEKIDEILKKNGKEERCSNLYPVRGLGGGEYGFLVSEHRLLQSLKYGIYREKEEELTLFPLFPHGGESRKESLQTGAAALTEG